jgi:hypothetical protein
VGERWVAGAEGQVVLHVVAELGLEGGLTSISVRMPKP